MTQEYISHPQINNGEPLPVYEMGKIIPGSPLWELLQNTPTFWEVIQQQKENSSNLTAATAER